MNLRELRALRDCLATEADRTLKNSDVLREAGAVEPAAYDQGYAGGLKFAAEALELWFRDQGGEDA